MAVCRDIDLHLLQVDRLWLDKSTAEDICARHQNAFGFEVGAVWSGIHSGTIRPSLAACGAHVAVPGPCFAIGECCDCAEESKFVEVIG